MYTSLAKCDYFARDFIVSALPHPRSLPDSHFARTLIMQMDFPETSKISETHDLYFRFLDVVPMYYKKNQCYTREFVLTYQANTDGITLRVGTY